MNDDTPVSKDFVDRAVAAERAVTDKQFEARDKAIDLLAAGVNNQKAVYVAIGIAVLSFLLSAVLGFALFALKFIVK
jgi:hypothetical protein